MTPSDPTHPLSPKQGELFLPLLDVLREQSRPLRPSDVYERVADKLNLPTDVREHQVSTCAGSTRTLDRNIRWAQQRAKLMGYVASPERNLWEITEQGRNALANARPGIVVTIFESDNGVALWAESQSAVTLIDDGTVDAVITSPPYPLLHKKAYANQFAGAEHAEWLFERAKQWHRILNDTGSLFLNLGDVWLPGMPAMDLYQERLLIKLVDGLGFHLNQRLIWHNPSKLPAPAEWVTVRRCRVTPATETVFWLGKANPHRTKADNRKVLRPYSAAMKKLIADGGQSSANRPSGYTFKSGKFGRDNGGAIAHNILSFANTASNDSYQTYCRASQLPPHPARFPSELVEWLLKLTTDVGDLVVDDFGGSFQTAAVCEQMNRRWISCEKSLTYLRGGYGRFAANPNARLHLNAQQLRPNKIHLQ